MNPTRVFTQDFRYGKVLYSLLNVEKNTLQVTLVWAKPPLRSIVTYTFHFLKNVCHVVICKVCSNMSKPTHPLAP